MWTGMEAAYTSPVRGSESRPTKWMWATPASPSVSPAGGERRGGDGLNGSCRRGGGQLTTRNKYPHASSTLSNHILHGCLLPKSSAAHLLPPHTCVLQHILQQHASKCRGADGANVPVQPLDRLHCLHLTAPVAGTLHRGRGEERAGLGCFPLGSYRAIRAQTSRYRLRHSTPHSPTLPSPLHTSSYLDGGGHHVLLELGLQLLQAQLNRAQTLALGGGGQGCQGCRGEQRCA